MATTNTTDAVTIQSNIKQNTANDMLNYALFMGGTNATSQVLSVYDPAINGYYRLFMVKKPAFLVKTIPAALDKFKHILEYANTAVTGLANTTVESATMQGGYNNKGFAIPTSITDGTNQITITTYEFSGMPVHEVIDAWVNGMLDKNAMFRHFNGAENVDKIHSNQTAEFIFVMTDTTGENVEYSCLLTNCWPTEIDIDNLNGTAGTHEVIQYQIPFQCTKYESLQINKVAKALLKKFSLISNSMNFYSGYDPADTSLGGKTGNYGIKSETGKYEAVTDASIKPAVPVNPK